MKAMIFAAGLGLRLGKITTKIPKALVRINGKSILQIAVEKITNHGFDDIIVNVHHFADKVEKEIDFLRKKGYRISVSDEKELLLETGGGLYKARWFFDNNPFLLYNVDIITDLDLTAFYRFHTENKGLASLAVRNRSDNRFFIVDNEGLIRGWCNKATGEEIISGSRPDKLSEIAFSGVHVVKPEIFDYMNDGIYSMTTLYLRLAANHRISTFRHDEGFWADIGTSENIEVVRKYFTKGHLLIGG
jgi:NDP-sugar pyrophosphorylase family protein